MSKGLPVPLLGILLWMLCIHNGFFADALYSGKPRKSMERVPPRRKIFQQVVFADDLKLHIQDRDLNRAVAFGSNVLERMERLESSLSWSDIHVKPASPSHGQLIQGTPALEALKHGKEAHLAAKATAHLLSLHCRKQNLQLPECVRHITKYKLSSTSLHEICNKVDRKCSKAELCFRYRTMDGSCNGQHDGTMGKSYTGYKRLLFAHYMDGVQELRRSVTKNVLPSARLVSTELVKNIDNPDMEFTLAVMQWSQFVEHDLAHTATSKMIHSGNSIECCDTDGGNLSPRYLHPFCSKISVPEDDKFYSKYDLECLPYVRSVPAIRSDCTFGPIDQLNQATHFLDGSQIYGSDDNVARSLRTFDKGQLQVTKKEEESFLPTVENPEDFCQVLSKSSLCFKSGDVRVNSYPHLTAMHTLWHREHNRIAAELAVLNPHWDDEILYQEARRIVIAEMQHITYNEWLPLILGKRYLKKIQTTPSRYMDTIDPGVSNSFATAALRFINSLMESKISLYLENRNVNTSLSLRDHFNRPSSLDVRGHFDALIRGLATQGSQKLDMDYVPDLTTQLYRHGNQYGFDIISFDIQRGRDHGLPGYAEYRTLCGLSEVQDFEGFLDVIPDEAVESLKEVYSSPHDVDLFIGGMLEKPSGDSLIGPTFSCIISDQMYRTRYGDRFFYTHQDQPAPFTKTQLQSIQDITLARIFCDNSNNIKSMQPSVFKHITARNNLIDCDNPFDIPRLDLHYWKNDK